MKWELTPKGAVVSDIMQAVNAAAAKDSNMLMLPLTFSPDLPLKPSLVGTNVLTGWAFVHPNPNASIGAEHAMGSTVNGTGALHSVVLLHLGRNSTALNISAMLSLGSDSDGGGGGGGGDDAAGAEAQWQLTAQFQPMGPSALLQNMSAVVRQVLPIPPSRVVLVPPYSVLRLQCV